MPVRRLCVPLAGAGLLIGATAICAAQTPASKRAPHLSARSEAADKADFEKVCGACHGTDMVSDIRAASDWKDTIGHMVALGAKGTREQMAAVMRVLLRTLTKVNINTATSEQLPLVLDISEATARAVVKYRAQHGPFQTLDDLKKVPGIDAAKLETRRDRIVF
jgi:competence protein ComEA